MHYEKSLLNLLSFLYLRMTCPCFDKLLCEIQFFAAIEEKKATI